MVHVFRQKEWSLDRDNSPICWRRDKNRIRRVLLCEGLTTTARRIHYTPELIAEFECRGGPVAVHAP